MPKADKTGWWPHGMTKTEKVQRNAVGYVAKYASKGTDDKLPKGARLTGSGGLSLDGRLRRAWWMCPGYIRAWCPDYSDRPRRASGGGWLAKTTGDYLPSLFEVVRRYPLMVRRKPLDIPPDDWVAYAAASCLHSRQVYSGFTL